MKRYLVNVFYSTFLPLVIEAKSEGEALRKAGGSAPYEKFDGDEAKELLFHLERFRELDEVGHTRSESEMAAKRKGAMKP